MENNALLESIHQDIPLKEVEVYIALNNDILTTRLVIDRTHKVVIRFSPDHIIQQIENLLKLTVWLDYEKRTLELLKDILKSCKKDSNFTWVKIQDFIKFAHFAFEASIERASWIKDKIVDISFKKAYDKYTSTILFILDQNISLLKKIKDINPKNEEETVLELKKLIKIGPRIQENILETYILITEKTKHEEIAESVLDKTLECMDKYYSIEEI